MAEVLLTPKAQAEFAALPLAIQARVAAILERLVNWPDVSGAKPLRGRLKNNWRIRTGDYRVVFRATSELVTVWKIGNRGGVYD
ncbi:MAG TPA: type II toxin-antitoxin system RelE/ParE family toxin [Tepidisphaeraceae bacterium]|jgi:mRNA-degrading endonuclease RelE of RelBE toxin-antitoxin system